MKRLPVLLLACCATPRIRAIRLRHLLNTLLVALLAHPAAQLEGHTTTWPGKEASLLARVAPPACHWHLQ